ncbi:killer cell lectin-like receptor subfamily B member 1B allele B [Microcaecilia unicolor]|uniref:Killer cell lectin-like receptor subfamily B member 1B allele B n=1 Tax=Microcaecilia unicolor TaxID=1415580 RepID=A0A6P7WP81_9AMPH|nr:killer cell lectin-like receptor subfamily B member 1B allele B [Microcaecilia unicolor]
MTGEVLYADLKLPGSSSSSHPPHHARGQLPRWYRSAFRISGVLNVILLLAVIAVSVFGFLYKKDDASRKRTNCNQNTSVPSETFTVTSSPYTTGEGSGAKPCPQDWLLHRGNCYYFSKEERNWSSSREDCEEKGSNLLVIRDQEERDFIQDKTQNMHHWIGLYILSPRNSWTWVDGSPFINGKQFSVSGPLEEGRCVAVKGQHFDSDLCRRPYQWICQEEAEV